jgi:hypothetical protein
VVTSLCNVDLRTIQKHGELSTRANKAMLKQTKWKQNQPNQHSQKIQQQIQKSNPIKILKNVKQESIINFIKLKI